MNLLLKTFVVAHNSLYRWSKGRRFNMNGRALLLMTTGARSGKSRTNPLVHLDLGNGKYALAASMGGARRSPGWFHNLKAHPDVQIELLGERIPLRARITEGTERDELYKRFEAMSSNFTQYQGRTKRIIPVVVLEPR